MPIRWRLTILNALVIGAVLVALGLALLLNRPDLRGRAIFRLND